MVKRRINTEEKVRGNGYSPIKEITIKRPMPTVIKYYQDTGFDLGLLVDLYYYSPATYKRWEKQGKIPVQVIEKMRPHIQRMDKARTNDESM